MESYIKKFSALWAKYFLKILHLVLQTKGKTLETEGKTLVTSVDLPIKIVLALWATYFLSAWPCQEKALVTIREDVDDQREGLGEQREGLGDQKGMPW